MMENPCVRPWGTQQETEDQEEESQSDKMTRSGRKVKTPSRFEKEVKNRKVRCKSASLSESSVSFLEKEDSCVTTSTNQEQHQINVEAKETPENEAAASLPRIGRKTRSKSIINCRLDSKSPKLSVAPLKSESDHEIPFPVTSVFNTEVNAGTNRNTGSVTSRRNPKGQLLKPEPADFGNLFDIEAENYFEINADDYCTEDEAAVNTIVEDCSELSYSECETQLLSELQCSSKHQVHLPKEEKAVNMNSWEPPVPTVFTVDVSCMDLNNDLKTNFTNKQKELKKEGQVLAIIVEIMDCANVNWAYCDRVITLLETLDNIQLSSTIVKNNPVITYVLGKLMKYVGNIPKWNITEQQAHHFIIKALEIRKKSSDVYQKCMELL